MEGPERLRGRTFADLHSRHHHDIEQAYHGIHHSIHPYSSNSGLNYLTNNTPYMQYPNSPLSHSSFPGAFGSSNSAPAILFSYSGNATMGYSLQPPPRHATLPSQQRVFSRPYSSSNVHPPHSATSMYPRPIFDSTALQDTEEQDSVNRDSGHSEPIEPALPGYPNVNEFDDLMKNYVAQLSPKKQDKALINAQRATNIRTVLCNKKTTAVESAQFRFWAKKMFSLQPSGSHEGQRKICHENKPIAVREKLFKILTRAHQRCQHGGRDKTSAQVRKVYSWVPKELISRFVKLCPTCRERRGAACPADEDGVSQEQLSSKTTEVVNSKVRKASTPLEDVQPPLKRRKSESSDDGRSTTVVNMPPQLVNSSSAFQNQNRWLSDYSHQPTHEDQFTPAPPYSFRNDYKTEASMTMSPTSFTTSKDMSHKLRSISNHSPSHTHELQYDYD